MTTIKSICYHNKNLNIFIFNKDLSFEWFEYINHYLTQFNCTLFDIKIDFEGLNELKTLEHISSEAAYYRYFIPQFIQSDKVLYLDSDLLVNGSLDGFWNVDLEQNFLAATLDDLAENIYQAKNNFNSGVMLINNKLWKEHNIFSVAIEFSKKYAQYTDGDQGILNLIFKGKWLNLSYNANYLVGGEYFYRKNNLLHYIQNKEGELPLIVHFNSQYKPWLPIYDLPFRDYYWFYYKLSWDEIVARHKNDGN